MKTFGKCILALLGVAVLLFCIGKMKAPDEALAYRERRHTLYKRTKPISNV